VLSPKIGFSQDAYRLGLAAVDPQSLDGRSEVDGKIGLFSIFADLTKGKKGAKI